jgi:CheY-like chemotaxis protein
MAHSAQSAAPNAVLGLDVSCTVLLVEDQPSIRRFATRVLEQLGCVVLQAADGREALAVLERHSAMIELLLTDVGLPHHNGFELASAARAQYPDIRILYATGSSPLDPGDPDGPDPSWPRLDKPYDAAALTRAVRTVLADA